MPSMLKVPGVIGGRAEIHERKKNLTSLNSFNNHNLSMQEMIDSQCDNPPFGMNFYKSPSNEMLMKRVPNGRSDRTKNPDF